jgi:hypothetical protein
MGLLVPPDFVLSRLDDSERRLVEALIDGTTDGWHILPDVGIETRRSHQLDVVIAHPRDGVALIEVKGYHPRIVQGTWRTSHGPIDPPPTTQLNSNRYALRDHLRSLSPTLQHLQVGAGLAFVNSAAFSGDLPPELLASQLILSGDLEDMQNALDRILTAEGWQAPIAPDDFELMIRSLRPDVEFSFDPISRSRAMHRRLESISGAQTRALERLDQNRRVFVTGGAGTGKTRLAAAWARRAAINDLRVLMVAFNEPLADELCRVLPERENLRVGAFLRVAFDLEGMAPLVIPENADSQFWNEKVVGHLHTHWPSITESFDVIIVDEAQDFSPAWLAQLTSLLDPDGTNRMLMVGDADQELHQRGFRPPTSEDGWVLCELVNNTRNSFQIARLLRQRLGGPPAPIGGPESDPIRYSEAADPETAASLVRMAVEQLRSEEVPAESILVVTMTSMMRDLLRERDAFVPWEQRGHGQIVCETARRVKGLEFDHVILVAPEGAADDTLLYVGISRAVIALHVIAHPAVGMRLGLQ